MRWAMVLWLCLWAIFSIPWKGATSTPQWEHVRAPHVRAASRIRPDHVLNVVFYVPLAPLGSTLGWSLPMLVTAGGGLSLIAEGVQVFSSDRSPDGNDFIANIGGTALGAALVLLKRRRTSREAASPTNEVSPSSEAGLE